MNEPQDETEEGTLGDPYKIPYHILPLAPAPSTKPPSLWELFRLGAERAPHFPSGPLDFRRRRSA